IRDGPPVMRSEDKRINLWRSPCRGSICGAVPAKSSAATRASRAARRKRRPVDISNRDYVGADLPPVLSTGYGSHRRPYPSAERRLSAEPISSDSYHILCPRQNPAWCLMPARNCQDTELAVSSMVFCFLHTHIHYGLGLRMATRRRNHNK